MVYAKQAFSYWFATYLTNRTHKTFADGELSDSCTIRCGVPQGSVLGLLLFIIYINDLPSYNLCSKVQVYADDTCLTVAHSDVYILEQQMKIMIYMKYIHG